MKEISFQNIGKMMLVDPEYCFNSIQYIFRCRRAHMLDDVFCIGETEAIVQSDLIVRWRLLIGPWIENMLEGVFVSISKVVRCSI